MYFNNSAVSFSIQFPNSISWFTTKHSCEISKKKEKKKGGGEVVGKNSVESQGK